MDYANLTCTLPTCSWTGIVPNVTIHFTETPTSSKYPFLHWVVNGANKTGVTIAVKITKNSTVSAVYK